MAANYRLTENWDTTVGDGTTWVSMEEGEKVVFQLIATGATTSATLTVNAATSAAGAGIQEVQIFTAPTPMAANDWFAAELSHEQIVQALEGYTHVQVVTGGSVIGVVNTIVHTLRYKGPVQDQKVA